MAPFEQSGGTKWRTFNVAEQNREPVSLPLRSFPNCTRKQREQGNHRKCKGAQDNSREYTPVLHGETSLCPPPQAGTCFPTRNAPPSAKPRAETSSFTNLHPQPPSPTKTRRISQKCTPPSAKPHAETSFCTAIQPQSPRPTQKRRFSQKCTPNPQPPTGLRATLYHYIGPKPSKYASVGVTPFPLQGKPVSPPFLWKGSPCHSLSCRNEAQSTPFPLQRGDTGLPWVGKGVTRACLGWERE